MNRSGSEPSSVTRRRFWALACAVLVLAQSMQGAQNTGPASATPAKSTPTAIRLVDVAQHAGITLLNRTGSPSKDYILDVNGNGAAFFDFDNDGYVDLLIVNGSTRENIRKGGDPMVALYKNMGNGTFVDVTEKAGLTRKGWGMGVCVGDFDNDGNDDVYITAFGPGVLYRNNGNGTFSDVTAKAGVANGHWGTNCAFGDYDRDGFVDLYVANYIAFDEKTIPKRGTSSHCQFMGIPVMCGPRGLQSEPDVLYHNNGDGTFTDVTEKAGIHDTTGYGFGVLFGDLDGDGWPDIFVANDSSGNFFFHNNHDGTFTEMALMAGLGVGEDGREQACMGVDAADVRNRGLFDLFITNFSHDNNTLYQNNGDGTFSDVSYPSGIAEPSVPYLGWGTGFADFDNDGLLDIFTANGHVYPEIDNYSIGTKYLQRKQLYLNVGQGHFREVGDEVGGGLLLEKSSRGAAFGDFDNDGRIDVVVINQDDRPTLLHNETANANHWVKFKLVGTRSNRDAIGARVIADTGKWIQHAEVRSGGSYLSSSDMRVHFGLADVTKLKSLEVRWPSGLVQKFQDLAADHIYILREGQAAPVPLEAKKPAKP